MNYELIKSHISNMINRNSCWNIDEDGIFSVDDKIYKPMPWRYDCRLRTLYHLAIENESVSGLCSYKATVVESKDADVYELLYRELDVCQWVLNDKIASVYALSNGGRTISLIAKTKKKVMCAIDIATTLSDETTPITRHEIVGQQGVISDRCFDEKIPTKTVYVFEDDKMNPSSYADLDLFLNGLNPEEVNMSEYMTDVITKSEFREETTKTHIEILQIIDCVNASLKTGDVVKTEVSI